MILSVIVGWAIIGFQYRQKVQSHYESFERLYRESSEFSTKVKAKIASLPEVLAMLREKSEIAPENYLSGGYSSSAGLGSALVGEANFSTDYSYQWPNQNGFYDDENKVEITLASNFNVDSFDKHVVELIYTDTKLNREIAAWMEQELTRRFDISVQHQLLESANPDMARRP